MLIIAHWILCPRVNALTLWPFIILKKFSLKQDTILLNHEKIHLAQQLELLVLPFYIWYLTEYLYRLLQYKNRYVAYMNISFEKEAYAHEQNLSYLKHRRLWRFTSYL